LKTDGLPTLRNEAFKEEEEEELHHREEYESLLSRRDKNANTHAAHVKEVHSTSKVHARERERKREMNQTIVKKTTTTSKRTRSRIFLRDEQPFKRAVPVPLEDVGEVFDRFFGGFVEP
jgi:hypothetical protein